MPLQKFRDAVLKQIPAPGVRSRPQTRTTGGRALKAKVHDPVLETDENDAAPVPARRRTNPGPWRDRVRLVSVAMS